MKTVKIKFIKSYLTYEEGKELITTPSNYKRLFDLGVAELVEEDKPKRGRKPKNKEELKDSIETK